MSTDEAAEDIIKPFQKVNVLEKDEILSVSDMNLTPSVEETMH